MEQAPGNLAIRNRLGVLFAVEKVQLCSTGNDELVTLHQLASRPGISIFSQGVNISTSVHKFPFNVAIHYPAKYHDMPIEEGWLGACHFCDRYKYSPRLKQGW